MTESFEETLRVSEQRAKDASTAAARLGRAAKQLEKAAANGDLAQLRVARSRLQEAPSSPS